MRTFEDIWGVQLLFQSKLLFQKIFPLHWLSPAPSIIAPWKIYLHRATQVQEAFLTEPPGSMCSTSEAPIVTAATTLEKSSHFWEFCKKRAGALCFDKSKTFCCWTFCQYGLFASMTFLLKCDWIWASVWYLAKYYRSEQFNGITHINAEYVKYKI